MAMRNRTRRLSAGAATVLETNAERARWTVANIGVNILAGKTMAESEVGSVNEASSRDDVFIARRHAPAAALAVMPTN